MKITEYTPGGEAAAPSAPLPAAMAAARDALLLEALPGIFHKLKNKLTPILGFTQILKSRGSDDFASERLERIERNAYELTENLNALKEYSRRTSPALQAAALDSLLEGMAGDWQALADRAAARVVLELEPGLPELPLDGDQVRFLLLELIGNAARALRARSAAEREIRVSLRRCGGALRLAVRDNGRGLAPQELESVWNPFAAGEGGGAGLGLSLCDAAVARHGARRSVASVPGEFSEFRIDFPLPPPAGRRQGRQGEKSVNPKEEP